MHAFTTMKRLSLLLVLLVLFFYLPLGFSTLVADVPLVEDSGEEQAKRFYVVFYGQTDTPATQRYLQEHLDIQRYFPEHGYIAHADADTLQQLLDAGLLLSYAPYTSVIDDLVLPSDPETTSSRYTLHLFPSADITLLKQTLAQAAISVLQADAGILQVQGPLDSTLLSQLEGVEAISGEIRFQAVNDIQNTISGTNDIRQRLNYTF